MDVHLGHASIRKVVSGGSRRPLSGEQAKGIIEVTLLLKYVFSHAEIPDTHQLTIQHYPYRKMYKLLVALLTFVVSMHYLSSPT